MTQLFLHALLLLGCMFLTLFWAGRGKFAPPTGFFKINAKRLKVWIWNLLILNKIL